MAGRIGKFLIEFDSDGATNLFGSKDGERRRKKTSRSDRGIREANAAARLPEDLSDVTRDIDCKRIRCCELAKTIASRCRLAPIDIRLNCLSA